MQFIYDLSNRIRERIIPSLKYGSRGIGAGQTDPRISLWRLGSSTSSTDYQRAYPLRENPVFHPLVYIASMATSSLFRCVHRPDLLFLVELAASRCLCHCYQELDVIFSNIPDPQF